MTPTLFPLPHIVYHVAGMGDWKDVVSEQLGLLREVGLSTADIRITYLGNECEWLEHRLRDFGISARIVVNDPNLNHCETFAMMEVDKIAKKERSDNPILYFHTKGVSNPGDWGKKRWRNLMQTHVIRQWKNNLLHLKDHDAVGVNWHEGGAQHFSGTFWIANPSWIRRLPVFTEYHHAKGLHRYTCEMWIGAAEWCKAKSLACRNEPFWNAWFDFDRFLPVAVPGHFDYRGTPMQQSPIILNVLPGVLQRLKPKRVLEIGTGEGGFARFVRYALNVLGMENVPVMTVDPTYKHCLAIAQSEHIEVVTLDPTGPAYQTVHQDVAQYVRQEGRTLIFCDGIAPPKEFNVMAGTAKVDDVILAHDYAPTVEYFTSNVRGQTWDWLETTDAQIHPAVSKYRMVRVEQDELQRAVWCGFVKTTEDVISGGFPAVVPGKKGIGLLTYNRPKYFEQSVRSVVAAIDEVDVVYVYNDGSANREYHSIYASLPDKVRVCHMPTNKGVAHGKNYLLNAMMADGCEYLFIMEDDVVIRDGKVFDAYVSACVPGQVEHMNFAHHGPANDSGPVGKYSERIDMYPNVVGAFSFYTNLCIRKCGLMDVEFKNVWEHVEHTARIIAAGLSTPFWHFADLVNSADYLTEIEGAIENSSIRGTPGWDSNKAAGLEYWKTHLLTPCPL